MCDKQGMTEITLGLQESDCGRMAMPGVWLHRQYHILEARSEFKAGMSWRRITGLSGS